MARQEKQPQYIVFQSDSANATNCKEQNFRLAGEVEKEKRKAKTEKAGKKAQEKHRKEIINKNAKLCLTDRGTDDIIYKLPHGKRAAQDLEN